MVVETKNIFRKQYTKKTLKPTNQTTTNTTQRFFKYIVPEKKVLNKRKLVRNLKDLFGKVNYKRIF